MLSLPKVPNRRSRTAEVSRLRLRDNGLRGRLFHTCCVDGRISAKSFSSVTASTKAILLPSPNTPASASNQKPPITRMARMDLRHQSFPIRANLWHPWFCPIPLQCLQIRHRLSG